VKAGRPSVPLLDRWLAKVVFDDPSGCWLWRASTQRMGHGQLTVRRADGVWAKRLAHAVAYELFVGSVPAGFLVHHVCGVQACVTPWHLVLMRRADHGRYHALRQHGHAPLAHVEDCVV
jgi:hypothetical protein